MSADGGHFEPRSGSLNTILEVDHLRTIDDMFAILAYWFQRRRFKCEKLTDDGRLPMTNAHMAYGQVS